MELWGPTVITSPGSRAWEGVLPVQHSLQMPGGVAWHLTTSILSLGSQLC